jgi:hypothetical protein
MFYYVLLKINRGVTRIDADTIEDAAKPLKLQSLMVGKVGLPPPGLSFNQRGGASPPSQP